MTYEELLEMCVLTVVTPQKLASCEPFCCDNQDLDEFFANFRYLFQAFTWKNIFIVSS